MPTDTRLCTLADWQSVFQVDRSWTHKRPLTITMYCSARQRTDQMDKASDIIHTNTGDIYIQVIQQQTKKGRKFPMNTKGTSNNNTQRD